MNVASVPAGRLVITPNPVILDGQRNLPSDLIPGESLYAFLSRHVDMVQRWEVSVDGGIVPEDQWTTFRPQHGQMIEVRGAVGKSVLKIAATIALMYFAWEVRGFAQFFWGKTAGTIAYASTIVAGPCLINRVEPK